MGRRIMRIHRLTGDVEEYECGLRQGIYIKRHTDFYEILEVSDDYVLNRERKEDVNE